MILVEDVLGDFGFRLKWSADDRYTSVSIQVAAFAIVGRTHPGNSPLFQMEDWESSDQMLPDIDGAEVSLNGSIKWDGCMNFTVGDQHWCGRKDLQKHTDLLHLLVSRAFALMGREEERFP